jgi:hypothetical protein
LQPSKKAEETFALYYRRSYEDNLTEITLSKEIQSELEAIKKEEGNFSEISINERYQRVLSSNPEIQEAYRGNKKLSKNAQKLKLLFLGNKFLDSKSTAIINIINTLQKNNNLSPASFFSLVEKEIKNRNSNCYVFFKKFTRNKNVESLYQLFARGLDLHSHEGQKELIDFIEKTNSFVVDDIEDSPLQPPLQVVTPQ